MDLDELNFSVKECVTPRTQSRSSASLKVSIATYSSFEELKKRDQHSTRDKNKVNLIGTESPTNFTGVTRPDTSLIPEWPVFLRRSTSCIELYHVVNSPSQHENISMGIF
ncbi:uncharacterized protein LOC143646803 [Tamandua tetradactyla]|uniref:uncharacterized protein LOC143646803 n=1 Tax=Tamandua tetradactyla TaxID=48850 RepID=UPI004053854D